MKIIRNEPINATELNRLFETAHWNIEPSTKLQEALEKTWGWLTVRDDSSNLIGFVRVFSDGLMHAYVLNMIVHPNHRKKGIGSALMTELMHFLGENKLVPTLAATPGNVDFYRKFGFETESNGITAMCIRRKYWED